MLSLSWMACLAALLPLATAACCNASQGGGCADRTGGTPCCGYGKCNIFCCACKGGCRHSKRDVPLELEDRSDATTTAFMEADTEGAGSITLDRYLKYMAVEGDSEVWVKWFNE